MLNFTNDSGLCRFEHLFCFLFSQVQLLISTQDVDNYKHIKRDLDLLRTMVEKSELWVIKKSSSGGDGKKDKKDKKDKKEKKEVEAVNRAL